MPPPDPRSAVRASPRSASRPGVAPLARTRGRWAGRPHPGPHTGAAGPPHIRAGWRTPHPARSLAYYRLGMQSANLYFRHGRWRAFGGAVGGSGVRSFGGSGTGACCGPAAGPSVRSARVLAPVLAAFPALFPALLLAAGDAAHAWVGVDGVDVEAVGGAAGTRSDRWSGPAAPALVLAGSPIASAVCPARVAHTLAPVARTPCSRSGRVLSGVSSPGVERRRTAVGGGSVASTRAGLPGGVLACRSGPRWGLRRGVIGGRFGAAVRQASPVRASGSGCLRRARSTA